jgi:hypothetical protein
MILVTSTNNAPGSDWLAKLRSECENKECVVFTARTDADFFAQSCDIDGTPECSPLKYNEALGRYGYAAANNPDWKDTRFIRSIKFIHPAEDITQ